jgi:hypothetical protein
MGYLIEILVGAAGSLVAAEVYIHAQPTARWLVRMAAARLPSNKRQRSQEEWLADLDDLPGAAQKLWWAAGCHWAATVTNARIWSLRRQERKTQEAKMQMFRQEVLAEIVRLEASGYFDKLDGQPVIDLVW